MPDGLVISPDLSLPLEAVTETFAILAKRGAGKTNAAVVIAEEMFDHGLPWVAVDPVGSWWGVRAAGENGDAEGLAVLVFGGKHADVPLEPTAGRLVADLIVEQRITCVLDVSEMTKADQRRFLVDFADRLYRTNTEPLHVFCEEADDYIPQQVRGESAKLVGAFETLIKRGRARGIGVTLITQRSASLNKDVLTQVETLIALRTPSPQDRKAILGWVNVHAAGAEAVDRLPGLANGEAYVFSPQWLDILQQVKFRRRRTFDSGATPEPGKAVREPTSLAAVDLAAIKEAMAASIEKADAQDPRKLQARIRDLERQLAGQVPSMELQQAWRRIARLEGALAGAGHALADLRRRAAEIEDLISRDVEDLGAGPPVAAKEGEAIQPGSSAAGLASDRPANGSRRVPPSPRGRETGRTAGDAPSGPDRSPDPRLGRAERAVLAVLVQHGPQTQRQLAVHAGYSTRASTIGVALSKLRQLGLVEPGHGPYSATDAGQALLGELPQLPTGRGLRDYWMGRLGKAERAALELLLEAWPDPVPTGELARAAGYSPQASTMGVALSKLRTFGLVDGNRASDELAKGVR